MTIPEHLKTPAELLAEGRRWALHPTQDENGVFRAVAVFEDNPGRWLLGEVSNSPESFPPVSFGTDKAMAAKVAIRWNAENHGISAEQYQKIVMSSLLAQEKMERVKIKRDPHTGDAVLFNGLGDPLITLEEENAKSLYQQIAKAYGLKPDEFRPECGDDDSENDYEDAD